MENFLAKKIFPVNKLFLKNEQNISYITFIKIGETVMDKILSTASYGICVFSLEVLQKFLKKEKVRSKKLLENFQKNKDRYLALQKEGVWVPFPQINSIEYVIKLDGYDEPFNDEWEQKMEYGGFNIEIRDALWISDIGSFYTFNANDYSGNEGTYQTAYGIMHYISKNEISYRTLDGNILYSGFRYDVPSGKYLLSIKGYARKQPVEDPNYGFLFSLIKVNEFDGFKNPREEIYDFNVANM